MRWTISLAAQGLVVALLCCGACGKSKRPIVIGSKNDPEQILLGEIIAQHLEHRLPGAKLERRLGLGTSPILYQAITSGEVTIFPESTGRIETGILKEEPDRNPAVVLERVRLEMARIAQLEVLGPLGFEDRPAVVVGASSAQGAATLSSAAQGSLRWKLGVTPEFQDDPKGLPALNSYHLPMSAPVRAVDADQLFPLLEKGELNMIVTASTDGNLRSAAWEVLEDDKGVFPAEQMCLLVRQDGLAGEPRLRAALGELSGKFSAEIVRQLNEKVQVEHREPAGIAAQFLASVGLQ